MPIPKVKPKFTGWSDTRLNSYNECPFKTYLKYGLQLCPCCYAETAIVAYDKPLTAPDGVEVKPETSYCAKRKKVLEKPEALANGIELDGLIEKFILGKTKTLARITHPIVIQIVKKMKAGFKAGKVKPQVQYVFDAAWNAVSKFTKGAWLRAKLDILRTDHQELGLLEVIDWKSGGIDKRTGQIRSAEKYDDQLLIYTVSALTANPEAKRAEASLVFIEAPHGIDPVVARESADLERKDLEKAQKKLSLKVVAMLNDETFAPRPGFYCRWCPYSKEGGGPCPVA